jgi:hypothetical protein
MYDQGIRPQWLRITVENFSSDSYFSGHNSNPVIVLITQQYINLSAHKIIQHCTESVSLSAGSLEA